MFLRVITVSDQAILDIPSMISQKPHLHILLTKSNTIHFQTKSDISLEKEVISEF